MRQHRREPKPPLVTADAAVVSIGETLQHLKTRLEELTRDKVVLEAQKQNIERELRTTRMKISDVSEIMESLRGLVNGELPEDDDEEDEDDT